MRIGLTVKTGDARNASGINQGKIASLQNNAYLQIGNVSRRKPRNTHNGYPRGNKFL